MSHNSSFLHPTSSKPTWQEIVDMLSRQSPWKNK